MGSKTGFRAGARLRAMGDMIAAWQIIGMLMGACLGMRLSSGQVEFATYIVASMMVCLAPGIVLGIVFDRSRETLVGGMFGLTMGLAVRTIDISATVEAAELGLLMGALIGATCGPIVRILMSVGTSGRAMLFRRDAAPLGYIEKPQGAIETSSSAAGS
jgi:hypothetical protein